MLVEEMASFRPGLHQRQLLDLHTLLDEVAGVRVEAIGTVVDLRDTQINKVHQLGGKAALHDIAIDATKGFYAVRSDLVVIETLGHCCLLYLIGVVSSLSSVSTTTTASSFAGSVVLVLRLMVCLEP